MAQIQYGSARRNTEAKLGGPTREVETNPTIGTSDTVIVKANPDRVALVIVNQGANDVFMALAGPTTSNGVRITANGGNISMDVTGDFTLPAREWHGIGSGGSSAVYVLEQVQDMFTPPQERS